MVCWLASYALLSNAPWLLRTLWSLVRTPNDAALKAAVAFIFREYPGLKG